MSVVQIMLVTVFCSLCTAQYRQESGPRSRYFYPDPIQSPADCSRMSPSYVCDPDHLITSVEADQLNVHIVDIIRETRCPCSHYSCSRHRDGYKVGIALTKKILPDQEFHASPDEENNERAVEEKRQEWLMHQAKLYAHHLQRAWNFSRCDEDVIIFYSQEDGVLYTAVGDVGRLKLNSTMIKAVSLGARDHFGPNGNIFNGLLKMVKDYRSVFFGAYQLNRPSTGALQKSYSTANNNGPYGDRTAAVILTGLIATVLAYLVS